MENVITTKESSIVAGIPHDHLIARHVPLVILPYIKGVSEQLHRLYNFYGVPAYFKAHNTLRQLLVRPKGQLEKERIVFLVYHIQYEDCDEDYVGELGQSLKARVDQHRWLSSTGSVVSQHINT